ncbi:MAG: hypothetical protein IPI54_02580 [Chitinophagaceae bacterium]|nr:hypothetical protein [Chitinophagaceae bacterium]
MKKLLLSSIIMLGICSFASAQNATDAKSKKLAPAAPAATATPQKSAVATQQNVITNADGTEAAVVATPAPSDAKTTATDAEMAKKKEAAATTTSDAAPMRNKQKIAAEKAAASKKTGN